MDGEKFRFSVSTVTYFLDIFSKASSRVCYNAANGQFIMCLRDIRDLLGIVRTRPELLIIYLFHCMLC